MLQQELECALVSESILRLPLCLEDRVGEHRGEQRDGPRVHAQCESTRVQAVPVGGEHEMHIVEIAPRLGREEHFERSVGVHHDDIGVEPAGRRGQC